MYADLDGTVKVSFDQLYFDPNNPRISPQDRPGYNDPKGLFADSIQENLYEKVHQVYDVKNLEESIISQGWVPIDQILVWEHPKAKKKYIVLEGNTRKAALQDIRERVDKEQMKLARMLAKPGKFVDREVDEQRELVGKLEQIITATNQLDVILVDAKTADELEEKLPRLLGVRHITHAQAWSPYATNLYILRLYERLFRDREGSKAELRLEQDLIKKVGEIVSLGATKVRRSIQAASAFSRFQRDFEDRLSEGDSFNDEDQYYFEQILQSKYPSKEFHLESDQLYLEDEMAEVLFEWAFKYPRGEGDDNRNVLRKAKDVSLWAKMKKYDDEKGTRFADELDVEQPTSATPMSVLEAKYQGHKAAITPVETIQSLLDSFRDLKADQLLTQADHIEPMLEELKNKAGDYLRIIQAVAKK